MKLEILKGSENYTAQVIKLPNKIKVPGLDNLVEVVFQGNSCLVGKDSNPNELYLFFPAESQLSAEFACANNLYRHSEFNKNKEVKNFFEDSRRVKAIKFKGVISSGFVIPTKSLELLENSELEDLTLKVGDEFNCINGIEICKKFTKPRGNTKLNGEPGSGKQGKTKKDRVDPKFVPEHMDTSHLMKNIHKLDLDTEVIISYKLHGTSGRYFNTLVNRDLTWKDKIAKFFKIPVSEKIYDFVCASRRVVKFVNSAPLDHKKDWNRIKSKGRKRTLDLFLGYDLKTTDYDKYRLVFPENNDDMNNISVERLEEFFPGFKNYFENKSSGFYNTDIWSELGALEIEGKLNHGEALYCEIIGKTFSGEEIQKGYSYGFEQPEIYVYRISNINAQGIEIDLSHNQMVERAEQLGLKVCPVLFKGTLREFILRNTNTETLEKQGVENYMERYLSDIFYNRFLEKPSILDKNVVEEGFCLRVDKYPKPLILKIKSKNFLLHEGKQADKEEVNIEDIESQVEE